MKNIYKKIISTLVISAALSTSAVAIEKLHFVIPGGAGGGWDGTARGTGEALLKSGLLEQASFENMSGGGGGKALAWLIRTQPKNTVMVQ
jgi:putative tricarboxylic transport membrane protein